jgi:hypothetical protein
LLQGHATAAAWQVAMVVVMMAVVVVVVVAVMMVGDAMIGLGVYAW